MRHAAGYFGFEAGHFHAKSIGQALRLLCRLPQGLLESFGGGGQAAWWGFGSLRHVVGSVTVSWSAAKTTTVCASGGVKKVLKQDLAPARLTPALFRDLPQPYLRFWQSCGLSNRIPYR